MSYLLIIKPTSGKFLKNYDIVGQMDPFLEVRVGKEMQKTDVAKSQGKTPKWNTALQFKITEEQYYHPQTVSVTFDSFDEDMTENEYIGSRTLKLSEVTLKAGAPNTIALYDKKNKEVGTIEVQFELKAPNQQQQNEAPKKSSVPSAHQQQEREKNAYNRGPQHFLVVRPVSGTFLKNFDLIGKMDPYLKVKVGTDVQQTEVAEDQGKTPKWTKALSFRITEEEHYHIDNVLVYFEAYDDDVGKDKFMGKGTIQLSEDKLRPNVPTTLKLKDAKNADIGSIEVYFDLRDAPVQTENPTRAGAPPRDSMGTSNNGRNVVTSKSQGTHPLIIRPVAGKFHKDYDAIGKMDPYVKIKIGNDILQTEVANGQGQTPKWTRILNFKLTEEQMNYPDRVSILVEAYDDDAGGDDFLGRTTVRLSDIKMRPGVPTTLRLLDTRGSETGTIDLFFSQVLGTIAVKPIAGRFDSLSDYQKVYLVIIHGNIAYQTNVAEGTGRKPTFKDILDFQHFDGEDMIIRCFDNATERNEMLCEGKITIANYQRGRGPQHVDVDMVQSNRKVGLLEVELEFFHDIFDNPVKIYPSLSIKRGEHVSKKIKYVNPDKSTKELIIKSENPDLVTVKTETLTIPARGTGEIKFTFCTQSRGQDEKCRIDIIVRNTQIVEESLLFKLKGI